MLIFIVIFAASALLSFFLLKLLAPFTAYNSRLLAPGRELGLSDQSLYPKMHGHIRAFVAFMVLAFFIALLALYFTLGRPLLASRQFSEILSKDPKIMSEREKQAYLEIKQLREGEDGARAQLLATIYLKQGRIIDALYNYELAIKLKGDSAPLWLGYGLAQMAADFGMISQETQARFAKAAFLAPKAIYPRIFIARALAQDGQLEEAKRYLQQFLQQTPDLTLFERNKILNYIAQYKEQLKTKLP